MQSATRRSVLQKTLLLSVLLLLAWDLSRSPERQLSARVMIGGIHIYRATLSSILPVAGAVCRFEPSCSHYAEASIRSHGALRGAWRSLVRIARCGPWTPPGTLDPP